MIYCLLVLVNTIHSGRIDEPVKIVSYAKTKEWNRLLDYLLTLK